MFLIACKDYDPKGRLSITGLLSEAPSGAASPAGISKGRAGVILSDRRERPKYAWLLPQRPEDTKWLEGEEADKQHI